MSARLFFTLSRHACTPRAPLSRAGTLSLFASARAMSAAGAAHFLGRGIDKGLHRVLPM